MKKWFEQKYSQQQKESGKTRSPFAYQALVTDRFSRNSVEQLLTAASGNVSETSRISGLSRVAIQSRTSGAVV